MTDEELNLLLAEARGYRRCYAKDLPQYQMWKKPDTIGSNLIGDYVLTPPNHVTGIEALGHLHEAEKLLTEKKDQERYLQALWDICADGKFTVFKVACATPRQRATALAKALGIWVDTIPHPTEQNPTAGQREPERPSHLSFIQIDLGK